MTVANNFSEIILTCDNRVEAEKIAQALLEQHLVACVKFEPVHSKYWWDGQLEENDEIKLSMLSLADNFDKIEAEVAKLHSYETFVLQAVPIAKLNEEAAAWLTQNARDV